MMNRDDSQAFRNFNSTGDVPDDANYPSAISQGDQALNAAPQAQPLYSYRRASDFSNPSQLLDDSQRSDTFQGRVASADHNMFQQQQQYQQHHQQQQLMDSSSGSDHAVRFLEQRIRDESTRATIAEQAYHRAREESRILQQAYLSLSPSQPQPQSFVTMPSAGMHPNIASIQHQGGNFESFGLVAPMPPPLYNTMSQQQQQQQQQPTLPPAMQMQYSMMAQPNVAPTFPYPQQRLETVASLRPFPSFAMAPSGLQATKPDSKPASALSIVKFIGSTVRQGQQYMDVTKLEDLKRACCDGDQNPKKPQPNMPSKTFPEKLHALLTLAETDEKLREVITFCPHGRAFQVLDIPRFCAEVVPQHFPRLGQWKSFTRQCNLYGFSRIAYGPDSGAYYSELFLRNHSYLCRFMTRVGVTQPGVDRRYKNAETRKQSLHQTVPDFYGMDPVDKLHD